MADELLLDAMVPFESTVPFESMEEEEEYVYQVFANHL